MLHTFDVSVLAVPTALIFGAVLIAASRAGCSPPLAWCLATVKAGIYLLYFGVLFDGTFTFLDDWTYLERGAQLHDAGVTVFNVIDKLPLLVAAGGDHFVYYLHNAAAISWFGEGYYAPVALNVLASVAVASLGTRLLVTERLCTANQAPLFFAFVLLHPDITAWSTIMNGKDTLVLLLHVLLLTAVSWYWRGRRWNALLLATATTVVLLSLRFYVPLLFVLALVLAAPLQLRGTTRLRLFILAAPLLAGLAWQLGTEGALFVLDRLRSDLVNPILGFARFLLTPIPFNTDANYAFLDLPAVVHWLLLPVALLGVWRVHRKGTAFAGYLIMYTLVFVALYSIYGELQGPRHRLQLDFAWATFQFIGIGVLGELMQLAARRRVAKSPAPGAASSVA